MSPNPWEGCDQCGEMVRGATVVESADPEDDAVFCNDECRVEYEQVKNTSGYCTTCNDLIPPDKKVESKGAMRYGEFCCVECRDEYNEEELENIPYRFYISVGFGSLAGILSLSAPTPIGQQIADPLPEFAVNLIGVFLLPTLIMGGVVVSILPIFVILYIGEYKRYPLFSFGRQQNVEYNYRKSIDKCVMCDVETVEGYQSEYRTDVVVFGVVILTLESGSNQSCQPCYEDGIEMALRASSETEDRDTQSEKQVTTVDE